MDWREQSADSCRDNAPTYQKVDWAQKIPWGTSLSFSDPIVRKNLRPQPPDSDGGHMPTFKGVGACRLHSIADIAEIRQADAVDRLVIDFQHCIGFRKNQLSNE
jgi:hypothetical protein